MPIGPHHRFAVLDPAHNVTKARLEKAAGQACVGEMSLATTQRPPPRRTAGLPPLLSVGEAAKLLGAGRSTLYAAIRSGHSSVPVVRVARQWRVPLAAVERILEGIDVAGVRAVGHKEAQDAVALPPGDCPFCGALAASSSRPTCSEALRSSSSTASV